MKIIICLLLLGLGIFANCSELTVKTTKKDNLFVQTVIYNKQQIFRLSHSQGIVSFGLTAQSLTCDISKITGLSNQLVKIFNKKGYKFLTCFLIKNDEIVKLSAQDITFIRNFIKTRMGKGEKMNKMVNIGDLDKLNKIYEEIHQENKIYQQKIKLMLKYTNKTVVGTLILRAPHLNVGHRKK